MIQPKLVRFRCKDFSDYMNQPIYAVFDKAGRTITLEYVYNGNLTNNLTIKIRELHFTLNRVVTAGYKRAVHINYEKYNKLVQDYIDYCDKNNVSLELK